jgi:hypothetical protein
MERLSTETARKSLAAATLAFLPHVPKEAINSPALPFSSLPSILLLPRIPFLSWLLPDLPLARVTQTFSDIGKSIKCNKWKCARYWKQDFGKYNEFIKK